MNRTFFEDLPARKVGGPVVSAGGDKKPQARSNAASDEGGNTEEKSAKKVRQAVYDIRYRARREGVDLKAAYSQYMGNTTMTGPEKDAVKKKLFGEAYSPIQKQIIANKQEAIKKMKGTFEGPNHDKNAQGEPVEEETKGEGANKKYKVRVTDKATGRTYVRFADREKIGQLRANPNIKSVEMTEHGSPYEGEAKKGEQTAATKSGKGLDPVGKEDGDVDNDGDKDKSDKYLLKRRAAIGKAMASRNEEVEELDEGPVEFLRKSDNPIAKAARALVSPAKGDGRKTARPKDSKKPASTYRPEEYSRKEYSQMYNWREEFIREMGDEMDADTEAKVVEKRVKNKVKINPKMGDS